MTPDDIRALLRRCRRELNPGLLEQARGLFQEARKAAPDEAQLAELVKYGRNVAAVIEDPQRLEWTPTADGLGSIARIDDDDYLVVHAQKEWWRAGAAWPEGEQPTYWSSERFPTRAEAIKAAGNIRIPQ